MIPMHSEDEYMPLNSKSTEEHLQL